VADNDQPAEPGATPARPDPAAGATPGGQQATGGATPPASSDEGAKPDGSLGDAGREALDRERTARREADRQLAAARQRVAELEDRDKSESERTRADLERARERITELEAQESARELLELKREVAAELELPPTLAPRLEGTDRRSLKADGQKLADELKAGVPVGDLGIGRGGTAGGQAGRGPDMTQLIREAAGRQ